MQTQLIRKVNCPPTPNLEHFKQNKNKSRSRRKPPSIPPTNQPHTPKHIKQLTLKPHPTHHHHPEPAESSKPPRMCRLHGDRPATHAIEGTLFCQKCYLINLDPDHEEVRREKKIELDQFRKRIKEFGLRLETAGEQLREAEEQSEGEFYLQKQAIEECFSELRASMEEKEREMLKDLIASQQQIHRRMRLGERQIEEFKESIERYHGDIERHYHEIIDCMSYEEFVDILKQYGGKLDFFHDKAESLRLDATLNVYLPMNELGKQLQRAGVSCYPPLDCEEDHPRLMTRHATEKHPLHDSKTQPHHFSTAHHDSIGGGKLGQQRQSREWNEYGASVLWRCANKENVLENRAY